MLIIVKKHCFKHVVSLIKPTSQKKQCNRGSFTVPRFTMYLCVLIHTQRIKELEEWIEGQKRQIKELEEKV